LVAPEDAVPWALYYPPIIDLESLRRIDIHDLGIPACEP
jgi:hypothetical protein